MGTTVRMLAVLLCASSAQGAQVENLISRPQSDLRQAGWNWWGAGGTAGVQNMPGPSGKLTNVLKLTQNGEIHRRNSLLQQVRIDRAGKRYRVSLRYKVDKRAKPTRGEYVISWLTLYPSDFPKSGARYVKLADSGYQQKWKTLEQPFSTTPGFATKERPGRIQVELFIYSELGSISYDDIRLVEIPVLLSPRAGATAVTRPTFKWQGTENVSVYALEYSSTAGFSKGVKRAEVRGHSYQVTSALPEGVWYWRVKAGDEYSEVSFFEVGQNRRTAKRIPIGSVGKDSPSRQISRQTRGNITFYVLPPVRDFKVLPKFPPVPATISHRISMVLSPGEYEPASFVVHATNEISGLEVAVTDLKAKEAIIPASNVDIRVVKCWYQSSQDSTMKVGKFLLPELLLKDDTLVRVDYVRKENHLKLRFPEGDRYVSISREDGVPIPGISTFPTPKEFPVRDSRELLPVDIPKATNKQFWVTLRAPDDAVPGIYAGSIELRANKTLLGKVRLRVRVLPIKLLPPYYTSSIFYDGSIHPEGKDFLGIDKRPEEQLKRELENLFAHGVRNPICRQGFANRELFVTHLKLREEIGMDNQPLYYTLTTRNPDSPKELASLKKRVKEVVEFCKGYGISEVHFYGVDEATGERLKSQRPAWKAVHEAGGKIYVAGYSIYAPDIEQGNFELMGDIQDVLICAHAPRREEAAKWHGKGHKIFCYANPQFGIVKPETYRRNYGLLLWQKDYDGAMNFNYYTGGGACWGNVWNDFDGGASFNDHNMVYPTADGVIDTTQWEGYREGVDDVRYLTTLIEAIKKGKKSRKGGIAKEISAAEKYLSELKDTDLTKKNLDTIRLEIITHILKVTSTFAAEKKSYACHRLANEPVLDGVVRNDPAWTDISAASGFVDLGRHAPASKQTFFKAGYTPQALYIGIECKEPEVKKIKAILGDRQCLWSEDSVEIFILTEAADEFLKFTVNAIGSREAHKFAAPFVFGAEIDLSDWRASVHKGEEHWSLEIRIPFDVFLTIPEKGEAWAANICRNVYTSGQKHTSWAALQSSFHEPSNFGTIVFKDEIPAEEGRETEERILNSLKNEATATLESLSALRDEFSKEIGKGTHLRMELTAFLKEHDEMVKEVAQADSVNEANLVVRKISDSLARAEEIRGKVLLEDLFQ